MLLRQPWLHLGMPRVIASGRWVNPGGKKDKGKWRESNYPHNSQIMKTSSAITMIIKPNSLLCAIFQAWALVKFQGPIHELWGLEQREQVAWAAVISAVITFLQEPGTAAPSHWERRTPVMWWKLKFLHAASDSALESFLMEEIWFLHRKGVFVNSGSQHNELRQQT